MNLFVIGNEDFTHHIKVPSYKVNKDPVYKEWTNLNDVKRRDISRYKISGSFTLIYDDITELDHFFDTINTAKELSSDDSVEMTVYVNNIHTTATITAFIKYTPANEKPLFGREAVSGFEVTIEEK